MNDLGINAENFNPRVLFIYHEKYDSGRKFTYHSHSDFVEIKYIFSGSCTYFIDNRLYPVRKGNVVICNPGISHIKLLEPGEEVIELNIGINNIFIKNLSKNFLIDESVSPVISIKNYEQDFIRCCNEIMSEKEKCEPGSELILKSLVMKLIVILLKDICCKESFQEKNRVSFEFYDRSTIVQTIVSFINENYMKEISLDKISRNTYLSPVYISKIFKEETGESPINYLIKVRLSKAMEMLNEGRLSIKAIAESVGYSDAYYFSKLFKKYYKHPPSKYRPA